MKNKSLLVIAIILMSIGFAAISTTLIINGSTNIGENTDDYSVIFTAATLDGTDVYNEVTSQDKKTITFRSKDLKKLNDTSVLNYEVTNNSSNYDAEVKINCGVKENTTAKYTSIKNELENNATVVKAKQKVNGTLTITLNQTTTEEITEEYTCTLEFNAVERTEIGSSSVSFATDSWKTIAANVKSGDVKNYNVGDTKEVDMGDLGTHTVRIANISECTTETSETACGFVFEFADIITNQSVNSTNTNVGGWTKSAIRTYISNDIFNALPSDLQNVIITTKVISGHGKTSGEKNFETEDKLYLLTSKEIYGTKHDYDTINNETKQLDYYKNLGVSSTNYAEAIKQYNGSANFWWLRSSYSRYTFNTLNVQRDGSCDAGSSDTDRGISPAFRVG